MPNRTSHRSAFTLVELLVVIGIIAVLISIIMPSIGGIRRQSKAIGCQANQKNLYAVCVQFANDHKNFLPTPTICGESPADPTVGSTCMFALEKNGVANFEVGQIWKYIPTIDSRRDMMWCPADDKEYQLNAGVKPDPDRNMSYSINANAAAVTARAHDMNQAILNIASPLRRSVQQSTR